MGVNRYVKANYTQVATAYGLLTFLYGSSNIRYVISIKYKTPVVVTAVSHQTLTASTMAGYKI